MSIIDAVFVAILSFVVKTRLVVVIFALPWVALCFVASKHFPEYTTFIAILGSISALVQYIIFWSISISMRQLSMQQDRFTAILGIIEFATRSAPEQIDIHNDAEESARKDEAE